MRLLLLSNSMREGMGYLEHARTCLAEFLGEGVREILFVRTGPFELSYATAGLTSVDGFDCSATLDLSVDVVTDRSDLAAFRKTVLGSRSMLSLSMSPTSAFRPASTRADP